MLSDKPIRSIILLVASNLAVLIAATLISSLIPAIQPTVNQIIQILVTFVCSSLLVFVIVPFVYKLPKDYDSFREYFAGVRLALSRPYSRIILFTIGSYCIFVLSQLAGSFLYGQYVFDVSRIFPPNSNSLLNFNPGLFEEIVFRGIVFTLLLALYSRRKSLITSAAIFGVVHYANLLNGLNYETLLYSTTQVIWAFGMGLFWGYLVIKTGSIIPGIILHYMSNAFDPLWLYIPSPSIAVDLFYMLVFAKFIPIILSILLIELVTNPRSPLCLRSYQTGLTPIAYRLANILTL